MRLHLWDRIRDLIVLAVLLVASVAVMVYGNDSFMRSIRALSLDVVSRIEARLTWAGQFVRAVDENAALRREIVELNSQVMRLNMARQENAELANALGFRTDAPFDMVAARIVSKDVFGLDNYLTLNVGADDGVEVDMAVVTYQGILGRVVLVSSRYCRVLSYLNTGFRVPVDVLPSRAVGMLGWHGNRPDEMVLENIVKTMPVGIGDTAVTSATSRIFPSGYPVGTVAAIDTVPGMNYLNITVRPAAVIERAQHAFVLLHRYDAQRDELESRQVR